MWTGVLRTSWVLKVRHTEDNCLNREEELRPEASLSLSLWSMKKQGDGSSEDRQVDQTVDLWTLLGQSRGTDRRQDRWRMERGQKEGSDRQMFGFHLVLDLQTPRTRVHQDHRGGVRQEADTIQKL